jgi:hypothetical protein
VIIPHFPNYLDEVRQFRKIRHFKLWVREK